MSQALYRTRRPALWEEVVGQDHIVQTLQNAIAMNRIGHAYLFAGPRGTGKTTSARLLAKAANCLAEDSAKRPCNVCANCVAVNEGRFLDLIEIDAASNTSVDDVRELRDKINFAPSQGKYKVYIIDEVHMLSTSAFNALLKTLEEPPNHVIFILATTEIHKIPATVLSRCQRFEFRRIPAPIIVKKLQTLTKQENIDIEPEALNLIARQATGALRDAISLVDQLSSISKKVTLPIAQDLLGTATNQAVIDLTDAIIKQDQSRGLEIIQTALDSGADSRQFARQTVEYLRDLLIIKLGVGKQLELTPEVRDIMSQHAESMQTEQLTSIIEDFSKAATDQKTNWHPGLGLELAYASAISWQESAPAPQVQSIPQASYSTPATSYSSPAPQIAQSPTVKTSPKVSPAPKPAQSKKPAPAKKTPPAQEQDMPNQTGAAEGKMELTSENLNAEMDKFKTAIKRGNSSTVGLINSARIYVPNNKTLVLNFATQILCDMMRDENNMKVMRIVVEYFFGKDIRIICNFGDYDYTEHADDSDEEESLLDAVAKRFNGVIIETGKED